MTKVTARLRHSAQDDTIVDPIAFGSRVTFGTGSFGATPLRMTMEPGRCGVLPAEGVAEDLPWFGLDPSTSPYGLRSG